MPYKTTHEKKNSDIYTEHYTSLLFSLMKNDFSTVYVIWHKRMFIIYKTCRVTSSL